MAILNCARHVSWHDFSLFYIGVQIQLTLDERIAVVPILVQTISKMQGQLQKVTAAFQ